MSVHSAHLKSPFNESRLKQRPLLQSPTRTLLARFPPFKDLIMSTSFISGTDYLDRTFEPIEDRLEYDCEGEEEEFNEDEETQENCGLYTLSEVGYSFNHFGGLVLHSKREKVEAIFKKPKTPVSVALPELGENECGICYTESEPHELITTSCNHQYCRDCFAYYLHLQSGDMKNLNHTRSSLETTDDGKTHLRVTHHVGVICAHPHCTHIIEGDEFRTLADEKTALRFQELSLALALEDLFNKGQLKRCKEKDCGAYTQNCQCTSDICRRRTKNARLKREAMEAFVKMRAWIIENDVRNCPKCGSMIEKNGGCDHMHCARCKTNYNWSSSSAAIRRI